MKIRLVKPQDCKQILNIYAQYINTSITFEYELPSEKDFAERIDEISKTYPYLVLEKTKKFLATHTHIDFVNVRHINGLRNFRFILTKILHQKVTVEFCMKN